MNKRLIKIFSIIGLVVNSIFLCFFLISMTYVLRNPSISTNIFRFNITNIFFSVCGVVSAVLSLIFHNKKFTLVNVFSIGTMVVACVYALLYGWILIYMLLGIDIMPTPSDSMLNNLTY